MMDILVAGIGNIFKGDDGFGVEVVRRLAGRSLPPRVKVVDFGIRGFDLSCALSDDCYAAVLVDTAKRGGTPGDLYLVEPEPLAGESVSDHLMISGHELDPAKVLRLTQVMGGCCRKILLVACEPLTFGDEFEGAVGLSEPVANAIEPAVYMIEELMQELTKGEMVE